MRVALPASRPNGHLPAPPRVFVIGGICQDPHFRLRAASDDFCLIFLGAPGLGAAGEPPAAPGLEESAGEPYFVLRRSYDAGEAAVALRVDWEGIFTILSNDDALAEAVFLDIVAPGCPEEVSREWSCDAATLRMFADLLALA